MNLAGERGNEWVACVGGLCGWSVWVACVGGLCGWPVWRPLFWWVEDLSKSKYLQSYWSGLNYLGGWVGEDGWVGG